MVLPSSLCLAVARLLCALAIYMYFTATVLAQSSLGDVLKKLADPKPSVRCAAVRSLSSYQWEFDIRAFRPLVAALRDPDPAVRKYAVKGLRSRRNPRAVPALLVLLKDPNPNVREAAIDTLQETGDPRAVQPLITIWQTDKEKRLRDQAFSALMFIGDMRATDALLPALNDPTSCVPAINALGAIGDDRAFEPLLAIAKDANHPHRQDARRVLAHFGDPRALDELLPQLAEDDSSVYFIAASIDPRVIPRLLKELETHNQVALLMHWAHDERLVEVLMKMADNAEMEEYTRRSAVEALGAIRDQRAVPLLMKVLKGIQKDNLNLRSAAIKALGCIGDAQAAPALVPLLNDKDASIQSDALTAVRQLQSPLAIDSLLDMAKTEDTFKRNEAYYALASIPDPRAVQSIVTILSTLQENISGRGWEEEDLFAELAANPCIAAEHYLSILSQKGGKHIFQALARTPIRDPRILSAMVQWIVREGYKWMPDDTVAQAFKPYGDQGIDALLAEADKPEFSNDMAISVLAKLGGQRAIPALKHKFDTQGSSEVILALGNLGVKEITPKILEIAQSNDRMTIEQRLAALEALGALKEPQAYDILITTLQRHRGKSDDGSKAAAIRGLGKLGDKRAIEVLIPALQDDDWHTYSAAAMAVLQLPPDPRTIEPLLVILRDSDSDAQARIDAVKALARFPDERILFEFCQLLQSQSARRRPSQPLRRTLVRLLGERKDLRAVRPLIRCLGYSSGDPGVAVEAARTLGQLVYARAVLALMNSVNDGNPDVRSAAAGALLILTGQNFGIDHARWVQWWLATKTVNGAK